MTTIAGWCTSFRKAVEPYAQSEPRYQALITACKPLFEDLEAAETGGTRLEGPLYALALLVEQHVSLHEDDPALIAALQKLFYALPESCAGLNRSFFELEIYPVLSIITIYG